MTTQAYPNPTIATFTPDAADRLMAINSPASALPSFSYSRDANDQVTSVSSTGVPTDTHSYGYTSLNQLGSQDSSAITYDKSDNPTFLPNGNVQTFDQANELSNQPISLVGQATSTNVNPSLSPQSVNLPPGIQAGDQILVSVSVNCLQNVPTPSGYQTLGSFNSTDPPRLVTSSSSPTLPPPSLLGCNNSAGERLAVFLRTATGGESSVSIGTPSTPEVVTIAVYRGVYGQNPVDAVSSVGVTLGQTVAPQTFGTRGGGEQLVFLQGAAGFAGVNPTWSAPCASTCPPATAMTEQTQLDNGQAESGGLADIAQSSAGTIPAYSSTFGATSQLVGIVIGFFRRPQYSFDARGNRTSIVPASGTPISLKYDQANRLTAYGSNASYAYNGDGLRMSKTVGTTTTQHTWDVAGGMPMVLQDASTTGSTTTTTSYIYGAGGLPIEQVGPSGTLYYHQDQLGSTRGLTNSSGTVVGTYTYDPYGSLTGSTGSISNTLGYAGQYTDAESGFIYMRARYYDPVTSQFLTHDPLSGMTRQAYTYGTNNPLNRIDPRGLYSYDYFYDLGTQGSPQELANFARSNCAAVFPLSNCADNFKVGQVMLLQQTYFWFYTQSAPVKVVSITDTSFSFVGLPGHPEGQGRTITFSFCVSTNGDNMLEVSTSSNGSALANWPGLSDLNFAYAWLNWSNLAWNIQTYFRTPPLPKPQPAGT